MLGFSGAGARYTKWIASLELRHKEHNNDSYPLHNNTIDFTQKNETIVHILTWYIEHHPAYVSQVRFPFSTDLGGDNLHNLSLTENYQNENLDIS